MVASRHIKREEILVPVAARHSKTPELNFNFIRGNENVTHSAQGETAFLGEIVCLEYPSRRSDKGNVYFADYRFSFRKLQIFMSQTTDFHFVSFHFVSQSTVSPSLVIYHFISSAPSWNNC